MVMPYICETPQIKPESLHLNNILFRFKSMAVVYRRNMIKIESLSKKLQTCKCFRSSLLIGVWKNSVMSSVSAGK